MLIEIEFYENKLHETFLNLYPSDIRYNILDTFCVLNFDTLIYDWSWYTNYILCL